MRPRTHFKINTIEELQQAYEMFKDRWNASFTLAQEIGYFNQHSSFRYVHCDKEETVFLDDDDFSEDSKEVESPLNKEKMTTTQQEIKELKEKIQQLEEKYEKENSFKVGDIVVSLEDVTNLREKGDIFEVLSLVNNGERIYYESSTHAEKKSFRKATPEEIEEYNNRNKLPNIGEHKGHNLETAIKYGCKTLSKSCLKEFEEAGIYEIKLYIDGKNYIVNSYQLEQIYKVVNNG